ncbi:hypothetical protein LIER_42860 [Lithospermum erythrorhizon]|uniref:Uncharacterized protein n=1 Tax=Lithospermum erythrorhizon TaxID=34254 RepID=A0AAV3P2L1_LITER
MSSGLHQDIPPNSSIESSTSAPQGSIPPRPDSPIMVMDPETLALARLYAAMGAEFTYDGHLIFSRDHDRFANIAIPQDVAQTVASRFNDKDLGGNPQDSGAIFVEPLSVRLPSSSTTKSPQVHPTHSASQIAGFAQAAENADKPGDPPTII